uniref:Putative bitil peptide n=1 Tax=Rhipicephalus pulchellus TaxID=72859 RepID=L7LTH6_RHIPC
MHYIAILLATTCFGLIDGRRNCTNCGPGGCSDLEQLVRGKPRKDRFCKPLFTPSWEKDKLRKCVCKRGFVRNSWGECISKKNCWRCKLRLYKDWHSCGSACPTTCGQPVLRGCPKKCSPGCGCIPGYVVHPKHHHRCVKADSCPPKCPLHSTFKSCVSSCEPKCSEEHPQKCVDSCDTGGCVCDQGYAYFFRNRQKICVQKSECSLFAPPPLSFTSKEIEQFNRGEGGINRPRGVGTNRESMPSRGGSGGRSENPSLSIPLPGAAGFGGNLEGAHPRGMPGGAGLGEGEVTGPSPFNGGLAGEALNFLRQRMPPSATEGDLRTGTSLSTGLASAPSLRKSDHNVRTLLPEGDLSRGFETRGGVNAGLENFVPPLQNAPISGVASTSENAVNEPLRVSSVPHGLNIGNKRETLLPPLSRDRLPGESAMRPGANTAIGNLQRVPTGEGPDLQPGLGQPRGTSEHGIAGIHESEKMTQPPPVAGPGVALSEDLRRLPRPPESEGHFPRRPDEHPSITRQFRVETRRSDVDIGMFGPPPPSNSGREEGNSEILRVGMPPPAIGGPGEPGIRALPSSAIAHRLGSEPNNDENARNTEPSAATATDSGERNVNVGRLGAPSPVGAGDQPGDAELQQAGPVTSSGTVGIMPDVGGPELSVSEGLEVRNRGETEEIRGRPGNVSPGERIVGAGTERIGVHVIDRNFQLRAGTQPVRRGSLGVTSHGLLGYGSAGVGMPRQRAQFSVMPEFERPHFAFYPPRATTRGAAELGESGFGERAGYAGIGARGSNMFTEYWNRHLAPAGAESRLPGGMGLYLAIRQPFFRIPYRRYGAGVNAAIASRVVGVPGYGGDSVRRYAEAIYRSRIAGHAGAGLRFFPSVPQMPGRRVYGAGESPLNPRAPNLDALTEYERARLRSLLVPPRSLAPVRHSNARLEFLQRVTPVNFSVRYNSAYQSAVVRDALLRADIAGRSADASGLYDGSASSGHGSLQNVNRLYPRPEGYHGTRSVEYELARLIESS